LRDHDLAADAQRLVDFVARLHGAEVAIRFLRLVVADLGGADRRSGSAGGGFEQPDRIAAMEAASRAAAQRFSRRFLGLVS
jgi:hypothetical protein